MSHIATPEASPTSSPTHGRHLGIALTLISAAQLMVVLDATIVNIALPHIKTALSFSDSDLTWVLNAYTLAFGGLLLLGGRMGDLLGRRKIFMGGVVLFALASLVGGLAQTEGMLLAARVVQGVGAAAASPTALSLITTTFPAGKARNQAFAVYAAMSGAGAAIGLILGGVLTEIDWRLTFFINVPIGLFVAALAPSTLAESTRQRGRFDFPGALTATVGLVGVVYALTHKAQAGSNWSDAATYVPLVVGLVLLVAFLLIEGRSPHALMPLRILADRTRAVSFFVMLITAAAIFSMFYFVGLYLQIYLGYSALQAGLAFLPFSVGIVISAQVASTLMSRVDPRWISGFGAIMAGVGLWLFHLLDDSPSLSGLFGGGGQPQVSNAFNASYAANILPPILVLSLGMGLIFVPMTLAAVSGVADEDSGVGSAVLNTMQQVGGALGLAILGTVSSNHAEGSAADLVGSLGRAAHGSLPTSALQSLAGALAQPSGYVTAFVVGFFMIVGSAVVIFVGLNVTHETLAEEGGAPGVPVG